MSAAYARRLREQNPLPIGDMPAQEKARAICAYVSGLWRHDGNAVPSTRDPYEIMEQVRQGNRYRCVEYAIVSSALLNAYGVPARHVALKMADCETREYGAGHVVTEYWDGGCGAWGMLDAQWGMMPLVGGRPCSCISLQRAIAEGSPLEFVHASGAEAGETEEREASWKEWIYEYLFYFDSPFRAQYEGGEFSRYVMLVPARSEAPGVFQRIAPLGYIEAHTHCVADFYPALAE